MSRSRSGTAHRRRLRQATQPGGRVCWRITWPQRDLSSMHPEPTPKLRMAPPEPAEDVAHRFERKQRAANLQRESNLDHSLAPFRVGSVGYLNTVPLTRGLEEEVIYATPDRKSTRLNSSHLG